jgi:hypothetical protein
MTADVAAAPPGFDLRDVIDGAALREQMQLHWTERDQRQFDFLIQMVASVNRLLPAPVSRFPFNACLQDLRLRMIRDRLIQLGRTVTPRSVR